jgi:hypothetical protein
MSTDTRTVRLVVIGIIISIVGIIGGTYTLLAIGKPVPREMWPVLAGLTGGLVAILSSTRSVDVVGLQKLADAREPPPDNPPTINVNNPDNYWQRAVTYGERVTNNTEPDDDIIPAFDVTDDVTVGTLRPVDDDLLPDYP